MSRAERIILAGHTGLGKGQIAHKLKDYLESNVSELANRVNVYDVEDYMKRAGGGDANLLAGVKNARAQRECWRSAWDQLVADAEKKGDRCSIVHCHLIFAQRGHRICPACLTTLAAWKPDVVVSLYDDVYASWRRIQLQGYHFSLAQLYEWRTIETIFADQVALISSIAQQESSGPPAHPSVAVCDSVSMSVKHPVAMLGRLLSDRSRKRVYLSFPISKTRGHKDRRQEIDSFRKRMHQLFVAFDPLCIEELPLVLKNGTRAHERASFHPVLDENGCDKPLNDQRWDCRVESHGDWAPLMWEPEDATDHTGESESFYPVPLDAKEIDELWWEDGGEDKSLAHDHVTIRDLRLVDQADFVVCYRPYWGGQLSGGVGTEVAHANDFGKPVYAFVGRDTKGAKPLQGDFTKQFTEEAKFWSFLEKMAKENQNLPRALYY